VIYSKEMHERSPLRVFEQSIHGGLGKGNLGVVMSRAGIGKTAFLIDVAIDDLLQERRVLHVTLEDTVERLRDFYDTLFAELRRVIRLADPLRAHLLMERNRMIHAYRGGELSVEKLRKNAEFLRDHAHFEPEVIILDGVDFQRTSNEELSGLKSLAQERDIEVWLSARSDRSRPPRDPRGVDEQVIRFGDFISVMVLLHPEEEGVIMLQLLKDHENENVAHLKMKLDPTTMLLHAGA
jgi:predicted ATP-dependent serine protease